MLGLFLLYGAILPVEARILSLDSCRALALANNKQISISNMQRGVATELRKSARTKYLPRVSAIGSYLFTSKEISLLNDNQKRALSNIGTSATSGMSSGLQGFLSGMTPDQKTALDNLLAAFNSSVEQMTGAVGSHINGLSQGLNGVGQKLVDDFRTDTRNIFAGAVVVSQPLFMGGSITAMNRMARISEEMASYSLEAKKQMVLYEIDQAYWMVVSLTNKKRLAESYRELLRKLYDDVQKMVREGVATRSEGLSVSVKLNEAEMNVTQVEDGLVLSRMLLCQLCGIPINEDITLEDEKKESVMESPAVTDADIGMAMGNRPELKVLESSLDLSRQGINLIKAGNLPQVLLVGGYTISNPNVYNGFQKNFGGAWNIGVLLRIPVLNWGDVSYKTRAAKGVSAIAAMELDEVREKIELQVSQSSFKVKEANKKLSMAQANIEKAEENLRCANIGFKEGVMTSTTVMEAQTAWLQAQSQKIDAEIDVRLSHVNLKKALGTLTNE